MTSRRRVLEASVIGAALLAGCHGIGSDDFDERSEPSDRTDADSTGDGTTEPDSSVLDVKDFGAEMDGETDDTQAIRDAIDAAEEGDTVQLPEGTALVSGDDKTYSGSNAILIGGDAHPDDLTFRGEGTESVIKMDGGHEENHMAFSVRIGDGIDGLLLEEFTIDGNAAEQVQATGDGGWNLSLDGARDESVVPDITVRNVLSIDANQTAFRVTTGGCTLVRCTAENSALHGFGLDAWGENRNAEEPITVRESYSVNNELYGIDCSGGTIHVEDCVLEGNGQGTKTTEEVIETAYRRCRFTGNDTLGYNRITTPSKTGQRAVVTFDDVIAEDNGGRGFRLGVDTDYQIGTIIARRNNESNETSTSISMNDNSTVDANLVVSYNGRHGSGLRYGSERESTIGTYVHFGNPRGGINQVTDALEIENVFHQADATSLEDIELDIDLPRNVPTADEVGVSG